MSKEFPWLSLDPDEEIVWAGTPRWIVVAPVALVALVAPVLLLLVWPTAWSALAGAAVWLAVVYASLVYVRNVDFVVSTKYLYSKRGVLGRAVTQMGLQNVQDATLRQGIFGTQFGHGTISFSTAGGDGDELRMYSIEAPTEVKARVDEQIARARSEAVGSAVEVDSRTGEIGVEESGFDESGVDALLSEARAMRAVAERVDASLASSRPVNASDGRTSEGDGGSLGGDRR